jgi:hypothetical protein
MNIGRSSECGSHSGGTTLNCVRWGFAGRDLDLAALILGRGAVKVRLQTLFAEGAVR